MMLNNMAMAASPVLVGGLLVRQNDVEAHHRRVAVYRKARNAATNVRMRIPHEAAQRRFHVRRVLRQEAHQSQPRQAPPLTEQESEVLAPGTGHALAEQTASGCAGDHIVGVVERTQIEPRLGHQRGRIHA